MKSKFVSLLLNSSDQISKTLPVVKQTLNIVKQTLNIVIAFAKYCIIIFKIVIT